MSTPAQDMEALKKLGIVRIRRRNEFDCPFKYEAYMKRTLSMGMKVRNGEDVGTIVGLDMDRKTAEVKWEFGRFTALWGSSVLMGGS